MFQRNEVPEGRGKGAIVAPLNLTPAPLTNPVQPADATHKSNSIPAPNPPYTEAAMISDKGYSNTMAANTSPSPAKMHRDSVLADPWGSIKRTGGTHEVDQARDDSAKVAQNVETFKNAAGGLGVDTAKTATVGTQPTPRQ